MAQRGRPIADSAYLQFVDFMYVRRRSSGETPEDTGSTPEEFARYRRLSMWFGWATLAAALAATAFANGTWPRSSLFGLLFVSMVGWFASYARYVSTWDELQQRIVVGAAANAFVVTGMALLLDWLLERQHLPSLGAFRTLLVAAIAYAVFRFILRRRYA
ncbi:MAG TPA: hypothetical protein VMH02_00100 [Verrucomicrobiae bacterium]|nr:hypothetical protein [Verrucomicrobiae bacterium]